MTNNLKHTLKRLRYAARRNTAARRWGAVNLRNAPAVLGNAMPKSGSHLIIQILEGLVDIGPFVDPGFPPVHRSEENRSLPDEVTLAGVRRMRPGEIRYGYLHGREPWISAATGPGRAVVFVHRDPRDWVISQIFYASEMHAGHMLHAYYNSLPSLETRIEAAIRGVDAPGLKAPSLVERYSNYTGWLDATGVLCLRFEDLVLDRETAVGKILDYLEDFGFIPAVAREEAISVMAGKVSPRKSGTFRKGQPGEWRAHFTDANLALFYEAAGDLLQKLGYEKF